MTSKENKIEAMVMLIIGITVIIFIFSMGDQFINHVREQKISNENAIREKQKKDYLISVSPASIDNLQYLSESCKVAKVKFKKEEVLKMTNAQAIAAINHCEVVEQQNIVKNKIGETIKVIGMTPLNESILEKFNINNNQKKQLVFWSEKLDSLSDYCRLAEIKIPNDKILNMTISEVSQTANECHNTLVDNTKKKEREKVIDSIIKS